MKKKGYSHKGNLHKWLCMILLLFVGLLPIKAGTGSDFYYNTTVYASPTAGGKVYVSTQSTPNPDYKTEKHNIADKSHNVGYAELTFYFYAQANENWIFDHWAQGSATGPNVSTSPSYNVLLAFNGDSEKNATKFDYYAVFTQQKGLIKVRSADVKKGSVSISDSENTTGQEVTLTANPDVSNGVMFLGWKKNNTGEYISTDNPLTLTAGSDTEGTYWAYFSDAAENAYIRLRNKKTGRFLSFYGNSTATAHNRTFSSQTAQDGFVFTGSLKMISATDAQGNPETVFLRTGHSAGIGVMNGVDLTAHEVKYSTLVGANTQNNKNMLSIENRNGTYRLFTTFSFDDSGTPINMSSYLCDEGEGQNQNYAVMKTEVTGEEADWELYSLDETTTEGAFGANTKEKYTKDNKYYTTMFTDFPYKLLDGVNAYYLVYDENFTEITDRVVFTQVKANNGVTIVPANTAVILECQNVQNDINSTSTVTNRLLPLLPNAEGTGQIVNEGANFLKGYISVNGSTVANNKKRMYVLSTNKEGVLGFHPYSKATMTPNKAYLLAPEATDEQIDEYAKKVTFSFGEPDIEAPSDPTGIELSNQMVDEDDSTPVYNLNGTKVAEGKAAENMLRPGVYVKKGKKFVVK